MDDKRNKKRALSDKYADLMKKLAEPKRRRLGPPAKPNKPITQEMDQSVVLSKITISTTAGRRRRTKKKLIIDDVEENTESSSLFTLQEPSRSLIPSCNDNSAELPSATKTCNQQNHKMNPVLGGVGTNSKQMANAKAWEALKPQKAIDETQTTSHQRGIHIIVVVVAVIIMVFGESMFGSKPIQNVVIGAVIIFGVCVLSNGKPSPLQANKKTE
mmetsp:Transcript_31259/g.50256  ORF Transcript_31259/g.50256 Transcript_31259/m.50256 type:complete len:215 (+) Transcript_31259:141-785(+)